jgi:hypothetical protein
VLCNFHSKLESEKANIRLMSSLCSTLTYFLLLLNYVKVYVIYFLSIPKGRIMILIIFFIFLLQITTRGLESFLSILQLSAVSIETCLYTDLIYKLFYMPQMFVMKVKVHNMYIYATSPICASNWSRNEDGAINLFDIQFNAWYHFTRW